MNWLQEAFLEPTMVQAVIIISLVSALGLYLGRIKIFGISLGITFVFFAGILAGHLGIVVNKDMLYFAQSFGLILFVYALGLQVGPGFFSSLKKGGVAMNMMGLGVILLGLVMTVGLHWTTGISLSNMVGLLCGAVTNTPALGAAQQALLQIDPTNTKGVTDMALACAVAYPCSGRDLGDYHTESSVYRQETERPKRTTRHDYLCRRVPRKQSGDLREEHQGRDEADGKAFRYLTRMEKRESEHPYFGHLAS